MGVLDRREGKIKKPMKLSLKTGFSFGLTSGVITTLGLMVGLHAGTQSKIAVIGGILTIAIADAFSDALGIHVSEESQNQHDERHIWESTISTFIAKFIVAMTFVAPVVLLPLGTAMIAAIAWGMLILGFFSYKIAIDSKQKPVNVILEHVVIGLLVVVITHFVGDWLGKTLG